MRLSNLTQSDSPLTLEKSVKNILSKYFLYCTKIKVKEIMRKEVISLALKKNKQPKKKGNLIFVKSFRHWRSGKIIKASDYGKKAFVFSR